MRALLRFGNLVWILVLLNLADGISTHLALSLGIAYEANPLMRLAWSVSPAFFWLIKTALIAVSVSFLSAFARTNEMASRGLLVVNLAYLAVTAIHIWGWTLYAWHTL